MPLTDHSTKPFPFTSLWIEEKQREKLIKKMVTACQKFIQEERVYISQLKAFLDLMPEFEKPEMLHPDEAHGLFRSVYCIFKLQSEFLKRIEITCGAVSMEQCWGTPFEMWQDDHADLIYKDFMRRRNQNNEFLKSYSTELLDFGNMEADLTLTMCLKLSSAPLMRLERYKSFLQVLTNAPFENETID